MIGFSQDEKIELYKRTKQLYDLRSRIAHGDLSVKKGPITWNSSIISAKTTIISISELATLAKLVTAVLRRVLATSILMDALQQSKKITARRA